MIITGLNRVLGESRALAIRESPFAVGCFLAALILIGLTVTVGGGTRSALFWGGLGALAIPVALRLAWSSSQRIRVLAIGVVYASLVIVFGSIHYAIFLSNPSSFSFASEIRAGKVMETRASARSALQTTRRRLSLIDALLAHPPGSPLTAADARPVRFHPHTYLVHGVAATDFDLEDENGKEWFPANDNRSPEQRAARKMIIASNPEAFRGAANDLQLIYEQRVFELGNRLSSTEPDWDLVDFWYFSAATMTTLGFGDILPNSRAVRIVVMVETISGLFLLSFALVFLWPEPRPDARGLP